MKFWKMTLVAPLIAGALAIPAFGQQYTTAAEVKPILDSIKAKWVSVREYDGKDLLYFTNLEAWRCGISEIHFAVNGGAESLFRGEPCYENEAVPAAQKTPEVAIVSFPQGSVKTVTVRLVYDDGQTDSASYQRGAILTP